MRHTESTFITKTILAKSLKKYMSIKPFKKITVNEIVNDCKVNRKTFYYHFKDIYDLLKWMFEQEAFEVVKKFDLSTDCEDAISFVIHYVQENSHILSCAYDSIGRDELKRFFYNDFVTVIRNVVDDTEKRINLYVTNDFKNFICDFLTESIAGMLINEFKDRNENKLNRQNVIKNFTIIINSLPDILKRAPQKPILR